jgi:hypothetical protein
MVNQYKIKVRSAKLLYVLLYSGQGISITKSCF